jgi:hypothetical protein
MNKSLKTTRKLSKTCKFIKKRLKSQNKIINLANLRSSLIELVDLSQNT